MGTDNVMRTKEAAAYVGLAPNTLATMRLRGNGPRFSKSGPKIVVYKTSDLDEWLESRSFTSTAEAKSAGLDL